MAKLNEEAGQLAPLAEAYLEALLEADRHRATEMIMDAVEQGTDVRDIYLRVLQPVQHEIGRLWQTNQVTVAQEHFCTASTQWVMSQLYGHIFSRDKIDRTLVATCVGGELHELGVRMVADLFEMEGWDTYYLGASTPTDSILDAIVRQEADVLAVSATLPYHVEAAQQIVEGVRQSSDAGTVKILVGGRPFNLAPDLWKKVGADGTALDARDAVVTATRLVG